MLASLVGCSPRFVALQRHARALSREPQATSYLTHEVGVRQIQHRPSRVENYIHGSFQFSPRRAHCLAHATSNPVTLDRFPQDLANRESHPRMLTSSGHPGLVAAT